MRSCSSVVPYASSTWPEDEMCNGSLPAMRE